jgi:hypothetical protein
MISAKQINAIQDRKSNLKKELYKEILAQFSKKIKLAVELGHTQVFLTIPEFVIGYPIFDREFATKYISRQLTLLGYHVTEYTQYNIYITWIRQSTKEEEMDILPSLANLRKAADTIRKKHTS